MCKIAQPVVSLLHAHLHGQVYLLNILKMFELETLHDTLTSALGNHRPWISAELCRELRTSREGELQKALIISYDGKPSMAVIYDEDGENADYCVMHVHGAGDTLRLGEFSGTSGYTPGLAVEYAVQEAVRPHLLSIVARHIYHIERMGGADARQALEAAVLECGYDGAVEVACGKRPNDVLMLRIDEFAMLPNENGTWDLLGGRWFDECMADALEIAVSIHEGVAHILAWQLGDEIARACDPVYAAQEHKALFADRVEKAFRQCEQDW